jgi:hypothetical protein
MLIDPDKLLEEYKNYNIKTRIKQLIQAIREFEGLAAPRQSTLKDTIQQSNEQGSQ